MFDSTNRYNIFSNADKLTSDVERRVKETRKKWESEWLPKVTKPHSRRTRRTLG